MSTDKPFPVLVLLAGVLGGCFGQNLTAPKGVASITPQSGPWQFTVDGHPEASGTYTFNFITNQGPATIKVTTAAGAVAQAPVNWSSGNFKIYVNHPLEAGYSLSEEISLAILSDSKMAGVYTYNGSGAAPSIGNGTLGATVSNNQPSYQATCTATFGAQPAASASPSAQSSPTPSMPVASASPQTGASPSPQASASPQLR